MTPAFSPGPWITFLFFVGRVFRYFLEDLYEQCSFHIAEKMPSSNRFGFFPIKLIIFLYSSGLIPCLLIISGVIFIFTEI